MEWTPVVTVLVVTSNPRVKSDVTDASARHGCGVFFASTPAEIRGLLRQVVFRFLVVDASTVGAIAALEETGALDAPPAVIMKSSAMFEKLLRRWIVSAAADVG